MQKMVMATTTLALLLGISLVPATNASAATYPMDSPYRYIRMCGTGYRTLETVPTGVGNVFVYSKGYYICAIHVRKNVRQPGWTGVVLNRYYSVAHDDSVKYSYKTDPVHIYIGTLALKYHKCVRLEWNYNSIHPGGSTGWGKDVCV